MPGEIDEPRVAGLAQAHATVGEVLADPAGALDRLDAGGSPARKIVAITSCPTGIAHTIMAAEGIQQAAKALGHQARVETQGSMGAQDTLTEAEIREANVILIAADTQVDLSRFAGKRVFMSGTKPAITAGQTLVARTLAKAQPQGGARASLADAVAAGKARRSAARTGAYEYLMTGVSYMIAFVATAA